MKKVELAPIPETPQDFDSMMHMIERIFREQIYLPLMRELGRKTIQNASQGLLEAIKSGRIQFNRGQFSGPFTSTLSKELKKMGALWDRTQGSWKIPMSKLPQDVRDAISVSITKYATTVDRIVARLERVDPDLVAEQFHGEKLFDAALFKTDKRIKAQLKNITVTPELTTAQRGDIAKDYTENLRLYIKDWTKSEIVELRERVEKLALTGTRYDLLAKEIQKSYGVSQNKAKFLARQETSLMLSKFKETRYRAAGSAEYIWTCVAGSPNHPVRPMHKRLDKTVQKWNDPPIIDDQGHRKHPGQDYNCRCTARPIIKY